MNDDKPFRIVKQSEGDKTTTRIEITYDGCFAIVIAIIMIVFFILTAIALLS